MHRTREGLSVVLGAAIVSLFAGYQVTSFGPWRLFAPVSVLLFAPALSGIGAAIALVRDETLPLPDPAKAIALRVGFALAFLSLGALSTLSGLVEGDPALVLAAERNVVLNFGLALLMIRLPNAIVWLPSVVLLAVTIVFATGPTQRTWLFQLNERASPAEWLLVVFLAGLSIANLARPATGRQGAVSLRRRNRETPNAHER